ncbi:diacylglycerol acyltransferase [Cooperia oncophora]
MVRLLGIDFSPLTEPWDRKLETLGVAITSGMLFPMIVVCMALPFILLLCGLWYIVLLYVLWYLYDRKSYENGGYENTWIRGCKYNQWVMDYFRSDVHVTTYLPADRNYIIGAHPHGVICFGLYAAFAREFEGSKTRNFPHLRIRASILNSNFNIMLRREWFLAGGFIGCDEKSIRNALSVREVGQAVVIIVGGVEESILARPGEHKIKLLHRKGFIKVAFHCGASLVPMYTFGETETYRQLDNPEGSLVRKLQMLLKRVFGTPLPFFNGRGLFQVTFGRYAVREWFLAGGFIGCDEKSIRNALSVREVGQAVVIIVGGVEESILARPGEHKIKLLHRKGFIKVAFHCGASLVPMYTFGETETYRQLDNPEGSLVRKLQMLLKRVFGTPLPFFNGRGLFQVTFGRYAVWTKMMPLMNALDVCTY